MSVAHCTNVHAASGFFVSLPTEISSPPANELYPPVLPGIGNTPQSNVFELSSCGMKNAPAGHIPTVPPWNAVSELDVVSVLADGGITPSCAMLCMNVSMSVTAGLLNMGTDWPGVPPTTSPPLAQTNGASSKMLAPPLAPGHTYPYVLPPSARILTAAASSSAHVVGGFAGSSPARWNSVLL